MLLPPWFIPLALPELIDRSRCSRSSAGKEVSATPCFRAAAYEGVEDLLGDADFLGPDTDAPAALVIADNCAERLLLKSVALPAE